MSVAKELPPVHPFFMQKCPLCGAMQRMLIRGVYVENGKSMMYPDMGYSFCNCKNIFFTKWENITDKNGASLNTYEDPIGELHRLFESYPSMKTFNITMRDPYFVNWTKPQEFTGFNPRVNFTLWDMDTFIDECIKVGFEVRDYKRDMDVASKTPECYKIDLRKS